MPDLDRVLDDAMALPYNVRMYFLDVVKKRTIEEERKRLAAEIKAGLEEYEAGKAHSGSVADLLAELDAEE